MVNRAQDVLARVHDEGMEAMLNAQDVTRFELEVLDLLATAGFIEGPEPLLTEIRHRLYEGEEAQPPTHTYRIEGLGE